MSGRRYLIVGGVLMTLLGLARWTGGLVLLASGSVADSSIVASGLSVSVVAVILLLIGVVLVVAAKRMQPTRASGTMGDEHAHAADARVVGRTDRGLRGMTAVDLLLAVTTGPARRRRLLTPVGLLFAAGLILLVIFGGRFTDRVLALPPLLPGVPGGTFGAGLLVTGLMLWGWCLVLFRGKGVPFNPPTGLVTAGPYAWVRNPMLTGLCVALFGAGFALHSATVVLLWTPAFVILNVMELKLVEEPELERRLGAPYREYRERVPMFIPKRPARGPRGGAQQAVGADETRRVL